MNQSTVATAILALFTLTIDWNPRNSDEGTYSTSVWALNEDEAEDLVLREMAEHSDSGCETEDERATFIANRKGDQNTYVARVADSVSHDLEQILKGPDGELTEQAAKDLAQLRAILKKYS